jgi:hypothetical protein
MVSGSRWRLDGGCFQGSNAVDYLKEDGMRGKAFYFAPASDILPIAWCCLAWCCHGQILEVTTDSGWPWYFPALSL